VQVFADAHGNCVSLFERDCSVQRRHQKVIEEAPAPGMTAERRKNMGDAAVAAARAVGYLGAGTVEFIADASGTFYFMEMNTRLQVEHPVTEMITGLDLVEWQLRVACSEPLPKLPAELSIRGHAIEARVYAENPDKGFLPGTGTVKYLAQPAAVEFKRNAAQDGGAPAAVRIDSGVREGDAITPYYDPMIAKLIVWGETRDQALARMRAALAEFHIVGLANNVDFLTRLMNNASFARALLDTGLIEREREALFPTEQQMPAEALVLACARVLTDDARAANDSSDPWALAHGWRLNTVYRRTLSFRSERGAHDVEVEYSRVSSATYVLHFTGNQVPFSITDAAGTQLTVRLADRSITADVVRDGVDLHTFARGRHRVLTLLDPIAHAAEGEDAASRLTAPMPGKVIAVNVAAGAAVKKGTALLVMEAMKMEHTIVAPADGTIGEILYVVGDQVAEGAELVRFAEPVSS
jgi:3-methylcrotonyl-CoA carboxylase alpha subunit